MDFLPQNLAQLKKQISIRLNQWDEIIPAIWLLIVANLWQESLLINLFNKETEKNNYYNLVKILNSIPWNAGSNLQMPPIQMLPA